jgi:hypothetical protein
MRVGTQFTGTLNAGQSGRWFTFQWPADWHVAWYMMPTTPAVGAPEVEWEVEVERASAQYVTYWLTVKNLTSQQINFEGRYAVLN